MHACVQCVNVVNAVVEKVGKLATAWNIPLYSMSSMKTTLRDPSNYGTLVRVSTPSDRFATAMLMFCHHNDVRASCTSFLRKSEAPRFTVMDY